MTVDKLEKWKLARAWPPSWWLYFLALHDYRPFADIQESEMMGSDCDIAVDLDQTMKLQNCFISYNSLTWLLNKGKYGDYKLLCIQLNQESV